jgi:beta-lactam-binding protein with PASTA domain
VSKGPQTVTVPDLDGMSGLQARATLRALGLVPDEHDFFGYSGTVAGPQSPDPGKTVTVGSSVTFYTV